MSEPSPPTSQPTPAETSAPTTPPTPTTTSTTPPPAEPTLLNQTEQQPAKTEPLKEGEKPKAAEGIPEKYADFTVPDGYELDKGVAEEAGTLFRELGLTQEAGQKLVDLYAKHAIESHSQALQAFRDTRAGWVSQAKQTYGKDVEPGGKVIVGVGRLLDSLGDAQLASDFKAAMDLTGAGDHPAFIGVMARLAERFGEGTPVTGKGASPLGQSAPGTARRSAAQEIYPNLA